MARAHWGMILLLWAVEAKGEDFLYMSSNQVLDTFDCEKKGFDGLIVSAPILISPKSSKAIEIICPKIRFEPSARVTVGADISITAKKSLEGPVDIIADGPAALPRVSITKSVPATAESGDKGETGRNLRGASICSSSFAKTTDAERMDCKRGEDADHGLPGRDGIPGTNGNRGWTVLLGIGGFRSDTTVRIRSRGSDGLNGEDGGRGQNGGQGGDGGAGANARPPLPCRANDNGGNGGDGGHGGNAGRGGNGGIGGRGGRGGNITVKIINKGATPRRGFLFMDNLGGNGGKGGRPNMAGEPGKAGNGGGAGLGGLAFLIRAAGQDGHKGKDGIDGQPAADGTRGDDGRKGTWGEAEVSVVE